MNKATKENSISSSGPWWRFPHMWMVIGGPLVVVVASVTTFFIAADAPDPILGPGAKEAIKKSDVGAGQVLEPNMAPAQLGRNHAATGIVLPAKPASN